MAVLKMFSLIGLLATSVSFADAECYTSGPTYSDLFVEGGTVDGAILDFCSYIVPRTYVSGQSITHCYQYDSSHVLKMELTNTNKNGEETLSYDDCYKNFAIERTGCKQGSQIVKSPFYYYVDPNDSTTC